MTASSRAAPILMIGALGLAGCGHSPPTRFFTLDATPAAGSPASNTAISLVQLDAVHIPAALDRPELVTQTGPGRLSVSDQDRWGAPLGQMMRRVLAQDLASRLPQGGFVFPDAPRPQGVRALVVTVLDLTATADGRVDLEANWTVLASGTNRVERNENLSLSASAGAGAEGQAQALSAVLGQLADRIAAALRQG